MALGLGWIQLWVGSKEGPANSAKPEPVDRSLLGNRLATGSRFGVSVARQATPVVASIGGR